MTRQPSYRVDSVDTLEGVDRLAAEWAALERETPEATGFQSYVWCRTWLDLSGDRIRPRMVCVREDERLVMLAPLQVERRLGVSVARWIGEPMTQYGDALAPPGARRGRWRALAEQEMAGWRDVDLIALTRLRADGVFADGSSAGERLSAPYVDLRDWTPRRRKSIERRVRRLDAQGAVVLFEAQTPDERERLARHAIALKRSWLRAKGVYSAGLSHPVSENFIATLARDGVLRVNALSVGSEIAAMDLGILAGGVYRSMLGCFDRRFAQGSPGQALTNRLVALCAEKGLSAYDMLHPADAYKLAWATGKTQIQARFLSTTLKGRLAAFAFARLRPIAKRAIHAVGALRARQMERILFPPQSR